jgi:N6-L-threonylcarbamoyladenine synthase
VPSRRRFALCGTVRIELEASSESNTNAKLRALTVLGIETSCDETAAAVVRGHAPGPGEILSDIVFSQLEAHAPYGGVVPEIAARAHVERLDGIVERALGEARVELGDLDAVAATAGPGLIGGVMVGLTTAKALALASGKPLVAVNHLEAHALTARLTDGVAFPYLLLLISGGHCQLLAVSGVGRFRLYGTTIDDAVGEAFDKTAKLLGIPYPGGPRIEALALDGDARRYALPRPMRGREGADFSFSGLKTAVRQIARGDSSPSVADLAASFQAAVIESLVDRTRVAMGMFRADFSGVGSPVLVVAGGVAANRAIGGALNALSRSEGFDTKIPPPRLCTDNAAMVAWTGVERGQLGLFDPAGVGPKARWPLASADPRFQGPADAQDAPRGGDPPARLD